MKEQSTVAVIGAGSSGLSMLKTLRENGFKATLYERRSQVGGLWAYSDDPTMTSALKSTTANISKYTCGMTDFPMPDKYPYHLTQAQFQEYMELYATHFDMMKDIVFNALLKRVVRNEQDTKWLIEVVIDGKLQIIEYDKVAFCHGYQTRAKIPDFEGREKFEGIVIHSQVYRKVDDFKGKRVVVVGVGATAGDIIRELIPAAEKVYASHRRGMMAIQKWRNGTPADLLATRRRRQVAMFLQRNFPSAMRVLADLGCRYVLYSTYGKLDPSWRVTPFPSVTLSIAAAAENIIPSFKDGTLTSLHGLKRFVGPRSIEFEDGTIIDDIDAVICATGYTADFTVAPFIETSRPPNYGGPPIARLWMNLFPPKYADSICFLCYSAYGKNNGFSFSDVISLAVSNVWRGAHPVPSQEEMEKQVDKHQQWVASRWRLENSIDPSMVKQWEFQGWLHEAAGTGLENLGWGWKGWKFWFQDREMYNLMNNGVETAYAFRFFETGKRKAWPGAREAIIHANKAVKMFPIKGMK
ncbi:putative dimethylaniline monooxygenase [Hypoxylon trugodes]|uniref:putative dimethylaniline monooxygenase n=1 Tax=Hypoxylon trugodes TaxID=326681 RepID=UPI00219B1698|nr:putative dimethylaniline monooxygenase [Hypoxylon trugodes]KAI1388081.1 putative dimethylaniline monooxygenase [Hypoxylon trugodes]